MNTTTSTDRIEKQIFLKAPRSRVWRALTDSKEFGAWFQIVFTEPFKPGATLQGRVTFPGYENMTMEFVIDAIEPERRFSYRWHPHAKGPSSDYSHEPMTLVEFILKDADGGTMLTVVESGFDGIPLARRAEAFKSNSNGWAQQIIAIDKYLRGNS
jgi:uncharacterized protein YndB with AHSA1/START domain